MIRLETEIFISHPPEKVWAALIDFEKYSIWNPFVFEAKGEAIKGAKLKIRVNSPDGKCTNNKPKIYNFTVFLNIIEANKMLAWASRPLFPWIFSGVHYFRLTPSGSGTLLTHGETFKGLIAHLMRKKILGEFPKGYHDMNKALAKYLDAK
jgi:hypothetical protein